jgi:hypothetical protein
MVQVDGKAIGELVGGFTGYDAMDKAIREHAAAVGLSYQSIGTLAGLAEGHTGKVLADLRVRQMGVGTFLAITETLGIKALFYVDPKLVAQMAPLWQQRDGKKAHAKRLARLSATTIRRILPVAAAEMGRRGGAKRRELPPDVRSDLARLAARARWQSRK